MKIIFLLGPMIPFLLVWIALRKKKNSGECLFWSSSLQLLVFVACIVIPYYFQGYQKLEQPVPGAALGWTALPFIGTFAYAYSSGLGFLWLCTGMIEAAFCRVVVNQNFNAILKTALIVVFAFLIFKLPEFDRTIGEVLE